MIHLKLYNSESDYLAYRDNKNKYLKPNVSFCFGNKEVYYNYSPAPQVNYDYVVLGLPSGATFTSKKDTSKSIFIPAAGYTWDGTIVDSGSTGNIWSSALNKDYADYGDYLNFYSRSATLYNGTRYNGISVRGVIG